MHKPTIAAAVAAGISLLNAFGFGLDKDVEDAITGVVYGLTIIGALFIHPPKRKAK